MAAAAIEAAGQFYSQRTELPSDLLVSATVQLLAAALVLTLAGIALGEADEIATQPFSLNSLLAFAYLVVPGSIIAYIAFAWLLANAPISTVSTSAYINPLVAILLGWALLSEKLTPAIAAEAAAVLLSVALIVRRQPNPPGETSKQRQAQARSPRATGAVRARPTRARDQRESSTGK